MSKFVTFFSLLFLAACAYQSGENKSVQTTFVGAGQTMVFEKNLLKVNGKTYFGIDCSSENRYCLDYEEFGLVIEIPEFCENRELTWFPSVNDHWEYIHGAGHHARGFYGMKNSELFQFIYTPIWGIQSIVYNQGGVKRELYLEEKVGYLPCNAS